MDVNTTNTYESTHGMHAGVVEQTRARGSPTDPKSKSETLKLTSRKLIGFRRFLLKVKSRMTNVFMTTARIHKTT
jgi:hypothetical protein